MIPVLFKEDEQVFTHNGIGALYESLSCDVLEEENGAFTMELEYPVDGELFSEIKDFRIIQAKPNDIDESHNFRIYEIEKSIDDLTVYVRANTRTNDLGNNLITNYVGKDITPQQAMNGIKSNLIEPTNFDLISDIQTKSNVEWTRINPLNAIVGVRGSLVDIWGGEIKRTNTAIHLYSRRGRDNVVTIRPGKNIEGLNMTVSTAGLVTKILPTFTYSPVDVPKYQIVTNSDGTKEKRRVTASGATTLRDDITVLGNVVSSQYVDNYPTNYWASVDYGDDDNLKGTVDNYIDTKLKHAEESSGIVDMSGFEQELKNFVKTELDKKAKQYFTHRNPGVDIPTVRIKVDMLQLSDSPDWEDFKNLERIGLTDTLDVWVEEYDIDVEVRVTSLTYDSIAEHVINFNAGSDRAPRQSVIEKKYDDLTKATDDYITSFKNGVQNVMRNTADGLNRKFEGYTEPPAELSSEGDIWFKEIGEGKVEIWIHDGVYWQPLMTEDFVEQLITDIAVTQAEFDEAKLQAVADSEQALADAIAHADAEDARIRGELESDIGGAIDIAEQAKADAVSKANQALVDAKAHADAEILLIETHFDDIIEGVESDVADAKQTADSALYKINNDIANKFTSLDAEVLAVETISNTAQANAQTALNQSLDALGDASTALTNAQTALNQVDDVSGTVDTHTSQISNINGQIALKANTTTVDTLTGRVSTAETGISANSTAIALKANTTTVNTLTGRVSTAESSISANATAIGLKASQTSVNTLTGTVNTLSGRVDVTAGQISSKVWNTDIQTAVDGIEVGGRNYYLDSKKLKNVGARSGHVTTINEDGELQIESTTTGGYFVDVGLIASANHFKNNFSNGEHYTVSFKIKKISGADTTVSYYDNNGFHLYTSLSGTITEEYSTVSGSAIKSNDSFSIHLRFNGIGTYVMKEAKLEKGTKATDWTPAPEDTTALINHVETTLTQKHDAIEATVSSVRTDLTGTTTLLNTTRTTVSGHTSSIATLRTDVNGKATTAQFNTLNSTVNGTITRVGNSEGKITTLETNVSGLQTTVASKAAQSQVTQLATGLSSVVTDLSNLEIGGRNLLKASGVTVSNGLYNITRYDLTEAIKVNEEVTLTIWGKLASTRSYFRVYNSGGAVSLATTTDNGDGTYSVTFKWIIGTSTNDYLNVYAFTNAQTGTSTINRIQLEKGNRATDWTPAPEDIQSQITQNATNINLRVTKNDVVNQINVSSEGILIDGKKVHITGTTTIDTGVIKNAHIGDLNASKINAGTINAARLDATAIVTAGLTANVIKSTHIETSTATITKLFATDAAVNILTAKTAFITSVKAVDIDAARITSGTINAARLNASAIVTAGLTANVVTSTHINGNTALFDKLFATALATDRLSARTAWIKSANIADLAVTNAKIANGTIASAKIASLDVSKISGNTSNFVSTAWNSAAAGSVTIDSSGIHSFGSDGDNIRIDDGLVRFYSNTNEYNGAIGTSYHMDQNQYSGVLVNMEYGKPFSVVRSVSATSGVNENERILYVPPWNRELMLYGDLRFAGTRSIYSDSSEMIRFYSNSMSVYQTVNFGNNEINNINRIMMANSSGRLAATGTSLHLGANTELRLGNYSGDTFTESMLVTVGGIRLAKQMNVNSQDLANMGAVIFSGGRMASTATDYNIGGFTNLNLGRYSGTTFTKRMVITSGGTRLEAQLNANGHNIINQSDRRLKRDIEDTNEDSLRAITNWNFVDFNWIDDDKDKMMGRQFGVIAQDTPELSSLDAETNTWTISSSKQIMMNSHAIQQLVFMEENTNKVASQALQATETNEEKIKRLEQRIEELESVV